MNLTEVDDIISFMQRKAKHVELNCIYKNSSWRCYFWKVNTDQQSLIKIHSI